MDAGVNTAMDAGVDTLLCGLPGKVELADGDAEVCTSVTGDLTYRQKRPTMIGIPWGNALADASKEA